VNPPFSPYEYFSYFFPGATVFGAYYFASFGPPDKEPGAAVALGVIGIAFVLGHAVAAVASWLEPILWGHVPGGKTDPTWGMFGRKGTYEESEQEAITIALTQRYGNMPFRSAYNLAYTELQQAGKDHQLKVMNQQIGFYRNMSFACLLSAVIVAYVAIEGHTHLHMLPWAPFFLVSAALFSYRYRRFWRNFGDNVVRGFRALPRDEGRPEQLLLAQRPDRAPAAAQ
jgi:hypothetical protein